MQGGGVVVALVIYLLVFDVLQLFVINLTNLGFFEFLESLVHRSHANPRNGNQVLFVHPHLVDLAGQQYGGCDQARGLPPLDDPVSFHKLD